MQEESELFKVRFTEDGKKYIKKFAAISYTMLVLILFEAGIMIYWNIRSLLTKVSPGPGFPDYFNTIYERLYPYISITFSLLSIASNIYYLRFPRLLFRNINNNDEQGANKTFQLLFKSAVIFFITLLMSTAQLLWELSVRRYSF